MTCLFVFADFFFFAIAVGFDWGGFLPFIFYQKNVLLKK